MTDRPGRLKSLGDALEVIDAAKEGKWAGALIDFTGSGRGAELRRRSL